MLRTVLSTMPLLRAVTMSLLMAVIFASPATAAIDADSNDMKLSVGKGEIITVPQGVSDILIADPKIADVSAIQRDKIYIVGTNLGVTNIMILNESGDLLKRYNVEVNINVSEIEKQVHRLFPSEKDVSVDLIGSQVVLTGLVSTPSISQKIARLVSAQVGEIVDLGDKETDQVIENLMEVRGEQQVMLRVRIIEMSRSVLKELGSELSSADPDSITGNLRGSFSSNGSAALTQEPYSIGSLLFDSGLSGIGDINLLINLLEEDNLANTLAEPNLTAISGEEAGFLAGGEFPVPAGRDQTGNLTIEYKKFGVSLNFRPIVLSDDRVSLQLNTEVSALNPAQGIVLSDVQIPGLDVRRASTTVEMNSGGSLMIAGLLRSDNSKGLTGIPGIKNTPVLGDLLSSRSFQRAETELVVMVTPYLVQPFADTVQSKAVSKSQLGMMAPPPPPAGLMAPGKSGKPVMAAPVEESLLLETTENDVAAPAVKLDTPLNKVFSKNMKQIYGQKLGELPDKNQTYGYMLD